MENGGGNGAHVAAEAPRIISIGINLNPSAWTFVITGDVPQLEVGLMLARHLVYELERRCDAMRSPRVVGAGPLDVGGFLSRNRG